VDLPGHGQSPRGPTITVDTTVAWLLASVPTEPDLAIGHSRGGSVLAAAATQLRPRRAVYVDTPFAVAKHSDPEALASDLAAAKQRRTLEYLRRERSWWTEADRVADADAARLFDVATSVSMPMSAAGMDLTPPATRSLMVVADPSDYVGPTEIERLTALGFEVRSVTGAGHSIWYGHFEEFMAALDGWI
jgi:pimeloyl-ACP methyl ester carboxylesterase